MQMHPLDTMDANYNYNLKHNLNLNLNHSHNHNHMRSGKPAFGTVLWKKLWKSCGKPSAGEKNMALFSHVRQQARQLSAVGQVRVTNSLTERSEKT